MARRPYPTKVDPKFAITISAKRTARRGPVKERDLGMSGQVRLWSRRGSERTGDLPEVPDPAVLIGSVRTRPVGEDADLR